MSGNKYTKASYHRGKAARLKKKMELKAAKQARMSIRGPKREGNRRKVRNGYGSIWLKAVKGGSL